MTFAAFALWFIEFALEVRGSVLSRKYPLLCTYLAFWAISDVATFLTYHLYGPYVYSWAYWIQEAGEYLILIFLACQVCGKMMRGTKERAMSIVSIFFAMIFGKSIWVIYGRPETLTNKLLDSEIAACMFLGILILVAWMGREKPLERPWNLIASGIVTLLACNSVLAYAWKFWEPAKHGITFAEIGSLILFNLAANGKLKCLRVGLGYRVKGERVSII